MFTACHYTDGRNPSPSDDHLFPALRRNLGSQKFNDDLDVPEVVTGRKAADVGRDSSVGVATRYGLDGPEIDPRWRALFSAPVQTGPGAYPASCTMGSGSSLEVKRPGRGADHLPPSYLGLHGLLSGELYILPLRWLITQYMDCHHDGTQRLVLVVAGTQCRAVGQQYQ